MKEPTVMDMSDGLRVVDLFSGLGGFSAAFLDRGWKVYRYDNDPQFERIPCTLLVDVMDMKPSDLPDADMILASPPCVHFSCAAAWRYWEDGRPKPEVQESVNLVNHALALIEAKAPRYWVLENPVGLLRKLLGLPAVTTYWAAWGMPYLKPTDLWGILPALEWPTPRKWEDMGKTHGKHLGVQENDSQVTQRIMSWYPKNESFAAIAPRAPALRALIPYRFSEALCLAAEHGGGQIPLTQYMSTNEVKGE